MKPGLVFSGSGSGFQWNDAGYFGAPSRELVADGVLLIDFQVAVTAMGLDLRTFTGFPETATVYVFAADDTTLIGTISGILLLTSGLPVFAGWEDAGGIGRFQLHQQFGVSWSPILDNLEFGVGLQVIPEPSSFALIGLGLVALKAARRARRPAKPEP